MAGWFFRPAGVGPGEAAAGLPGIALLGWIFTPVNWEPKGLLLKITPSALPSSAQSKSRTVRDEGTPDSIPHTPSLGDPYAPSCYGQHKNLGAMLSPLGSSHNLPGTASFLLHLAFGLSYDFFKARASY